MVVSQVHREEDGGHTGSAVSRDRPEYTESNAAPPAPESEEAASGSVLTRAYSRRDATQKGHSSSRWGRMTSTRYGCRTLAVWNCAQAAKMDVLSMTWAVELRSRTSPREDMSEARDAAISTRGFTRVMVLTSTTLQCRSQQLEDATHFLNLFDDS